MYLFIEDYLLNNRYEVRTSMSEEADAKIFMFLNEYRYEKNR